MQILIPLLTFMTVSILIFAVAEQLRRARTDPVRRRLAGFQTPDSLGTGQLVTPSYGWSGLAQQLPRGHSNESELLLELRRAGYFHSSAADVFLGIRNGVVITIVVAVFALIAMVGPQRNDLVVRIIIVGLALAGFCWGLPRVILRIQGRRRIDRINRGLPFALDLLTMGMSGGLSLPNSLRHVSRELQRSAPDLAAEFEILQQQGEMTSLDAAFANFADRVGSPDTAALSALIIQNHRLGTNVATSINDFADSLRAKRRQVADERAAKAGVQMLIPLTIFLMPAVVILLWGPATLQLWDFIKNMDLRIPEPPPIPIIFNVPPPS